MIYTQVILNIFRFAVFCQVLAGCSNTLRKKQISISARSNGIVTAGGVLTKNTIWTGEVHLTDDLLIPKGISLTVEPASLIKVEKKTKHRIDPMFISEKTEILVHGFIITNGEKDRKISFASTSSERWAGIILVGAEARAVIRNTTIEGAQTGLYVLGGKATLENVELTGNDTGALVQKGGRFVAKSVLFSNNGRGLVSFGGNLKIEKSWIKKNKNLGVWVNKSTKIELIQTNVEKNGIDFLGVSKKN